MEYHLELVYLWVENYKKIKRQGFNFSSQYHCVYDDTMNVLTINENEDYIENFFGENINLTAIVGKNGSGKSSILEVLTYLYWQGLIADREDKTFFLYKNKDEFYIQCENFKILPIEKSNLQNFISFQNNTKMKIPENFSARTDMPLILFSNCISDMTYNKRLESLKSYDNFYNGIQPDEPLMKDDSKYENFNQKFQYILQKNESFFDFIDEDFMFDSYQFEIHISELGAWIAGDELYKNIIDLNEESILLFEDTNEKNHEGFFYRFMALYIIGRSEGVLTYDDIEQKSREETDAYAKEYIFDKVKDIFDSKVFNASSYNEVLDICFDALEPSFKRLEKDVREDFNKEKYSARKIEELLQEYKYAGDNIWKSDFFSLQETDLKSKLESALKKDLLKSNVLRCNFINSKNIDYHFLSLSSGEKLYLNFLVNYTYTLFKLKDKYRGVMLFDEIELSFHPNWQKKILSHLLHIYKKILKDEKKSLDIHLLFSSHSPFVLSDLPKDNVIFLKDGEQVEGVQKKQTFGANIHTLLSDSFFMEDGLMGEFAKNKIQEIMDYLNDKKSIKDISTSMKSIKDVIENIGEPFLRQKLLDMYYKKFEGEALKKARKDELIAAQQRIEEELKKL